MSTRTRIAQLLDRARTNLLLDVRFVTTDALPLTAAERWAYLPRKYAAILRNQRTISFLGRPFSYDNRLMPALMQGYPEEIQRLDRYIDFRTAVRVMDVGANVGQFGFVLKAFYPHLEIVSFEPNPEAYALLAANAARHEHWRCVPFGLARDAQIRDFFVVEGKSAQGSVFEENASLDLMGGDAQRIQVRLEHLTEAALAAHDLPRDYDFVKIDVEGFERDVLASLDQIRWRFLYLELSVARSGSTSLEDVVALITQMTGRAPRVVYQQTPGPATSLIDVILASG